MSWLALAAVSIPEHTWLVMMYMVHRAQYVPLAVIEHIEHACCCHQQLGAQQTPVT